MGWPGPTTARQFRAWLAWLDMDLERPGKAELYAMQTALEVRRGLVKNPNAPKLEDMRLRREGAADENVSVETQTAWAKAKWKAQ
jgi:hypothetical protein